MIYIFGLLNTAVLLIIFNRFDTARQVLDSLRAVSAPKLYIFCDGPRGNKEGEDHLLSNVKENVLKYIDWNCVVVTNFRTENVGPKMAIGNAVTWMFETEEQGIILEHDCVPNKSFFSYCENLLNRYQNDERVMHISGDNFQFGKIHGNASYYFSQITHIWGWATWRRAWKFYDVHMKSFPEFKSLNGIRNTVPHDEGRAYWSQILEECYLDKIESWDYQWNYALLHQNGLSILPNVNLVSNVGFDEQALNTKNPADKTANMKTRELGELIHPDFFMVQVQADMDSIKHVVHPSVYRYIYVRILELIKKFLPSR